MSILKKIAVLSISYYLLILISGCLCRCEKQKFRTYSCENLALTPVRYVFEGDSVFNLQYPFDNFDTVSNTEYGIGLNLGITKYALQESAHSFALVNTAHACKCPMFSITPNEHINNITVTTVNDFNTTYPAGSDVSELFVFLENSYNPLTINKKPLSYLTSNAHFHELIESMDSFSLYIYLNAATPSPRPVKFIVTVSFTGGKSFTATTKEVFVQ